jgi:hypothetical protein
MHKVLRDKSRLYFLVKNKQNEMEMEQQSEIVYLSYL